MPDPVSPPDLQAAVDYLRHYGASYSVEALSEQLRQRGVAPEVLAQAVFNYNQWREETLRSSKGTRRGALYWTCGILVTLAVAAILAFGLCMLLVNSGDFR